MTHAGMKDVADKLGALLKSPNLEASGALQVVKNLFFVGKWFVARLSDGGAEGKEGESDDGDGEGEDEDEAQDGEDSNKGRSDALPWLFSKLSYQARSAQIARRNRTTAPVRGVALSLSRPFR